MPTLPRGMAEAPYTADVSHTAPIRRWGLSVLAWLLLTWEPLTFAWLAAAALGRISQYGAPALGLLVLRASAVGVGMAGGRGLLSGQPHGITLAKASLILSAVGSVGAYLTPYFPTLAAPSQARSRLLVTLAYYVAWYTYLRRTSRAHQA